MQLARSLHAIGDATLGQVVGGHFDLHLVAGQDADVVLAHPPGDMGNDLVAVLESHAEHGVRKGFRHRALEFDHIVFCHEVSGLNVQKNGRPRAREAAHSATNGAGWGCSRRSQPRRAGASSDAAIVPKRPVHAPVGSGSAASSARAARKRSRGQSSAPSDSRWSFSTCASSSGKSHSPRRRDRAAKATFEPPDSELYMLSPKNIFPTDTPYSPPTSRSPAKTSMECACPRPWSSR